MQIQNNLSYNKTNLNQTPNFGAINSVKSYGLMKNSPATVSELLDAFKKNDVAMNFCKKLDTDIIFDAVKEKSNTVTSSITILYDKPNADKFKKFLSKIFGLGREAVCVVATDDNFQLSAKKLHEEILPYQKHDGENSLKGLLSLHLETILSKIKNIANKEDYKNLKNQIQSVINETKKG